LGKLPGISVRFNGATFNEFVVRLKKKPEPVLAQLRRKRIVGGVGLGRWYPELADCLLCCVTEQKTREQMEALAAALGGTR
jgi:glycine dehydrogenase subunit 1